MGKKEVERIPLDEIDLQKIIEKEFTIERLNKVRDIFLFSCYSGLAYIDVKNLKKTDIEIGVDGEEWIASKRQKTNTPIRIPLLPVAKQILSKYANSEIGESGFLLPTLTNQKMNSYLKEIADLCGIRKKLTFHIARHTLATTITLTNGVPLETVDDAMRYAERKNVLIIHCAGNDGVDNDGSVNYHYPVPAEITGRVVSNYITVGWNRPLFNYRLAHPLGDYGKQTVDLYAPGSDIYSTIPGGDMIFQILFQSVHPCRYRNRCPIVIVFSNTICTGTEKYPASVFF